MEWFRGAGIEIRCNERVAGAAGRSLLEGFAAVFLGTGAHRGRPLGVAGENGPGVRPGLEFLKAVNSGERPDIGRRVVIVGGGNTALDCARTAFRLGATPLVVYRRTRQEMPAIATEIEEAEREGIAFEFLANPRAFLHEDGRLTGVECERMVLGEPDASGRRRPVAAGADAFVIPADTALTAIGEDADPDAWPEDVAVNNGSIVIDELGRTRAPKFWAGGDAGGVERTVSDALGSGKAAAVGIDRALRTQAGRPAPAFADVAELRWSGGNISMSRWRGDDPIQRTAPRNDVVGFTALNTAHFAPAPRHAEVTAVGVERSQPTAGSAVADRPLDFDEVNLGLAPLDALAEARRCFNCAVCNACELCVIFCPDVAISRRPDGVGFDIDLDYCKGCGVCALECPRGAIVMTREGR
jgi:NADPH-dependent glutamate synthase beta subunit-like oxidoreductase